MEVDRAFATGATFGRALLGTGEISYYRALVPANENLVMLASLYLSAAGVSQIRLYWRIRKDVGYVCGECCWTQTCDEVCPFAS